MVKQFSPATLLRAAAIGCAAVAGPASAALIGVLQSYPDVALTAGQTLIYDHNGVNATTGLLRLVAGAASLSTGPGSTVSTQSYTSAGDSKFDSMLTLAINNTTGALVANSPFNRVTINSGNVAGTNWTFNWQGVITNFGFDSTGNTNAFDAQWLVTSDSYGAVPVNLASRFFNGALTGRNGGIKISSTGTAGQLLTGNIWAYDWIRGSGVTTGTPAAAAATISDFTSGLTTPNIARTTVAADVFVPLPAPALLFASGLAALLVPFVRRQRSGHSTLQPAAA